MTSTHAVVIGGGPAGLALSWHLQRRNIDHLTLEQHEVGGSWTRMPSDFDLITPAQANVLPGQTKLDTWFRGRMSCNTYGAQLQAYAESYGLEVREHTRVDGVEPDSTGAFRVHTSGGAIAARSVVCATGYFSNPYLPPIESDSSIPTFHVSDMDRAIETASALETRASVLIVGRRISAGQAVVIFADMGCEVTLSANQPIDYQPHRGSIRRARETIYFPWEDLKGRLGRLDNGDSYPMMQGGRSRSLIESGSVATAGRPLKIMSGTVITESGAHHQPDVILYATGFRPALSFVGDVVDLTHGAGLPLTHEFMERTLPGLFFLGLDNLNNFRSRYLRGIRHDAGIVADQLDRFLRLQQDRSRIRAS